MQRPDELPRHVAAGVRRSLDPLGDRLVDDATIARAQRANLSARIAANALLHLRGPELEALVRCHRVELGDSVVELGGLWRLRQRLADDVVRKMRLANITACAAG